MQKITQSFPVSVVSVPDSVISVSVLYRDHFSEGEALLNMRQTAKNTTDLLQIVNFTSLL